MFERIFDLGFKRNLQQAMVFYFFYLFGFTVVLYILHRVIEVVTYQPITTQVLLFEQLFIPLLFTYLVIIAKHMMGFISGGQGMLNSRFLIFTIFLASSGILIGINGFIPGLFISAFLTTYPKLPKSKTFWS